MLKYMDILTENRQMVRFQEKLLRETAEKYGLARNELEILLFLADNPQYDTAKEIVEYQFLNKSCVSKGVDSLVKHGYLSTREDEADRRVIHLDIQEKSREVISRGQDIQRKMKSVLCRDISSEDLNAFGRVRLKMLENARKEKEMPEGLSDQM